MSHVLLLLLVQRDTYALADAECRQAAAAGSEDEERHGIVREVAVQLLVQRAAFGEVRAQAFDLHQRAHHHKDVKELVALPDEVAPPGEQALRVRAAEEVGADEEEEHVVEMVNHHRVGAAVLVAPVDAVDDGAYVQAVGQGRGHHLEELVCQLGHISSGVFTVAAAEAGQPGQERRRGQEEPLDSGVPLLLNGIVVVCQGAAVLVHGHSHIIEEVEGVIRQFGLGGEEMSQGTKGEVGEGRQEHDEERLSVRIPQEIHRLRHLPPLHQDDEGGQQVAPDVEGLIVPLEKGEEVVAPTLLRLPVAGEDVAFAEHPGDVRHLDGARQRGKGRLQELRDLTELLDVDEQTADLLHHHRRHGKTAGQRSGQKNETGS